MLSYDLKVRVGVTGALENAESESSLAGPLTLWFVGGRNVADASIHERKTLLIEPAFFSALYNFVSHFVATFKARKPGGSFRKTFSGVIEG